MGHFHLKFFFSGRFLKSFKAISMVIVNFDSVDQTQTQNLNNRDSTTDSTVQKKFA